MDKQYEPLINALLTDVHSVDVDRIYESLYDPHDACITITEAIVSRSNEQKKIYWMHLNQVCFYKVSLSNHSYLASRNILIYLKIRNFRFFWFDDLYFILKNLAPIERQYSLGPY